MGIAGASGATGLGGSSAGSGGATGGGGSGGMPDAGAGRDATSDGQEGGPAGTCAPDVLCFDFEKDTVGAKPGAPWTGQGTIDGTKSVSGKNSLHVVSGGDNAFAMMKPSFFPPAGNEYFGRVMFWVDNVPNSHWTFVRSKGAVPGQSYSAEYTYGGSGKMFIANYDTQGVSSDCWKDGASSPWVSGCAWSGISKDPPTSSSCGSTTWRTVLMSWARATAASRTARTTSGMPPRSARLELGFATYPTATTFNVWFDDLALAKARVGCPDVDGSPRKAAT